MCEEKQNNKGKQCAKCISRRTNAKGIRYCSLGITEDMLERKCGSFEYGKGSAMNDYIFEYGHRSVDQLTEDWLNGDNV